MAAAAPVPALATGAVFGCNDFDLEFIAEVCIDAEAVLCSGSGSGSGLELKDIL